MKISKITFYRLKSGIIIVSVLSSDGIEGIGQFIGYCFNSQKNYFEELIKPRLINKKININKIWDELYWYAHGKNGWLQVISAINIALYDLVAKSKKIPLCKYLQLDIKKKNKMYWSIGHGYLKSIKEMQKKIDMGLKLGFKAFKIRMDWHELRRDINPKKDFQMLKAVRKMLPKEYYLAFDANAGYSPEVAIYQGKLFENLGGISHFEEPVATNDLFSLKKVVDSLNIPISFGEYEKTSNRFLEIMKISRPDIIQPDLLNIGGITEFLKLFNLIEKKKVKVMPHSPDIGILCFASLHMSCKYSNLPHEFSPELYNFNMTDHSKIFNENILPENGEIVLSENHHGLGLTLNKKELKKRLI